jgi:hypothetical protein
LVVSSIFAEGAIPALLMRSETVPILEVFVKSDIIFFESVISQAIAAAFPPDEIISWATASISC